LRWGRGHCPGVNMPRSSTGGTCTERETEIKDRLTYYLKRKMPQADELTITNLQQIPGGASRETWYIDAEWREGGCQIARSFVMRRDPTASLLNTNREVEFRVLKALEGTPVPAPKAYWLELDGKVLERPFFIMEKVDGVASSLAVPAEDYEAIRGKLGKQFIEILAHLHAVDWKARRLSSYMTVPEGGTDAAAQQIAVWEKVIQEECLEPWPALTEALTWLKKNMPEAERVSIIHSDYRSSSDYRSGNFLFVRDRITAILDWEMVHLGDPMEDLAWVCMEFWKANNLASGLLPREEVYRIYESLSGTKVNHKSVQYYEALSDIKLVAIWMTGVRSWVEGRSNQLSLAFTGFNFPSLLKDFMRVAGL
jgi:aminoglycoside phosphotransferase (APT) family kinase protein